MLSFVGPNDAGKLAGKTDEAILTVFKKRQFDEIHLLWNYSEGKNLSFEDNARHVRDEIVVRNYCNAVRLHRFDCNDIADHNEIYPKLLAFCQSLQPSQSKKFAAAVESGTPAMQVCWILMAESGDFPLELIRSNEPKFGKPPVTPIRLGTGLGRILRLEQESEYMKKEKLDFIPQLTLSISRGTISVAGVSVPLSPVEFAYYRYFAERAAKGLGPERFCRITVSHMFLNEIIQYHKTSFPDAELFRRALEQLAKAGHDLSTDTFRSNISKANTKIRTALRNPAWAKVFEIGVEGKRHATSYGIKAPKSKIRILR